MTRRHALPKESQHALDRLRPARALRAVGSARQFTARVPSAGRHEDPRQRERAGVEHRLAERPAVAPPPAHLRSHWRVLRAGRSHDYLARGHQAAVSTKAGEIVFQRAGVTHIEEGVSDAPLRAAFVELKQSGPYGTAAAGGDAPV